MKLCFLATTPFVVNPFLLGHMARLTAHYDVTLCVNMDLYPLSEQINPRIRVIHVPMARKMDPLQDLKVLWHLIKIFHQEKFDSVHSIMPKAGLLGMMAGLISGVPHRVHTFTGQVWATKTGWKRAALKMFDLLTIFCATRVFSDSTSQSRLLETELGLGDPVGVMGKGSISGVNMSRFRPHIDVRRQVRQDVSVPEDTFVFLFVGRVAHDKGVSDMVAAFKQLYAQRQDVALWVVGPDEEGLSKGLQDDAGDANVAIHWLGSTATPERYMIAADMLLLPSYREGFGLVIVEAGACETPALAYRIDGVIDSVEDGETGILVPLKDTEALAENMCALVSDLPRVKTMGAAARQRVVQDFTSQAISTAWLEYYDTCVKLG